MNNILVSIVFLIFTVTTVNAQSESNESEDYTIYADAELSLKKLRCKILNPQMEIKFKGLEQVEEFEKFEKLKFYYPLGVVSCSFLKASIKKQFKELKDELADAKIEIITNFYHLRERKDEFSNSNDYICNQYVNRLAIIRIPEIIVKGQPMFATRQETSSQEVSMDFCDEK